MNSLDVLVRQAQRKNDGYGDQAEIDLREMRRELAELRAYRDEEEASKVVREPMNHREWLIVCSMDGVVTLAVMALLYI